MPTTISSPFGGAFADYFTGGGNTASTDSINFVVADWVAIGNEYQLTYDSNDYSIPNVPLEVEVYDTDGSAIELNVDIDRDNGDLTLTVNAIPDCRFDGYVNIIFDSPILFF